MQISFSATKYQIIPNTKVIFMLIEIFQLSKAGKQYHHYYSSLLNHWKILLISVFSSSWLRTSSHWVMYSGLLHLPTYSWAMLDFRKPHWTAFLILVMFVFFSEAGSSKTFYVRHLCLCTFCSFHSSHHRHHRLSAKFHVFVINYWSGETATSDVICMESLVKNDCLLVKNCIMQLRWLFSTKITRQS